MLSIVTTVYRSRNYLEQFLIECLTTLEEIDCSEYEIIFVNDGSPDDSLPFLLEKQQTIKQIKIIDLSRNFGHHYAAFAGLKYSKGDLVFIIDCDLEISPNILVPFMQAIQTEKHDVVYGFQQNRKGNLFERFSGKLFWKTINFLSDIPIPENIVTERLMTRSYLDSLLSLGDRNLFLGGMMYWTGYNQKGIEVEKKQRLGKSTYSAMKRFSLLFEAIISFSTFPLKMLFYFGISLSIVSFILGSFLLTQKLIYPHYYLSGYVSLMLVFIFFSGIIEMSLGIIGLYLGKIFKQVQSRPLFIVKNIY